MAIPAPAAPKIKKLGDYEVLDGTSPVAFCPIDTKGTLTDVACDPSLRDGAV